MSLPLAIVGTSVFSVVACYHAFLLVRHRTFVFWTMLVSMLLEVSAFGLSIYNSTHVEEPVKIMTSYVLSIISPSIAGVSLMTLFFRITWYTTPASKRNFKTTWLPNSTIPYRLFKSAYTVSLILTAIAAAILTGPDATVYVPRDATETLLRRAMILQACCLTIFTIITAKFTLVSRRQSWPPSALLSTTIPQTPYHTLLLTILFTSLLLIIRTIFRALELSSSSLPTVSSFLYTHEYTFLLCDALPLLLTFALFAYVHPSHALPRKYTGLWFNERKVRKLEKKVLESQEWAGDAWVPGPDVRGGGDVERQGPCELDGRQQRQEPVAELGAMEGKDMVTVMCRDVTLPSGAHLPARN